jgi:hypothetical protein
MRRTFGREANLSLWRIFDPWKEEKNTPENYILRNVIV